jgi:hypothetical protein
VGEASNPKGGCTLAALRLFEPALALGGLTLREDCGRIMRSSSSSSASSASTPCNWLFSTRDLDFAALIIGQLNSPGWGSFLQRLTAWLHKRQSCKSHLYEVITSMECQSAVMEKRAEASTIVSKRKACFKIKNKCRGRETS